MTRERGHIQEGKIRWTWPDILYGVVKESDKIAFEQKEEKKEICDCVGHSRPTEQRLTRP